MKNNRQEKVPSVLFKEIEEAIAMHINKQKIKPGNKKDWILAIKDSEFFLIHGLDENGDIFANIWFHRKERFLLKKFMPNINELEEIIILGDNTTGYQIFSYIKNEVLDFQDYSPNQFLLFNYDGGYDVVLTDGISKLSILSEERNYSKPNHLHILTVKDGDVMKITKDPNSNRTLIINDHLVYDIEQQKLINT